MRLLENECYLQDLRSVSGIDLPWEKLRGKRFLISGATGMIGCTLIQVLMDRNDRFALGCSVTALGRNMEKGHERLGEYWGRDDFTFVRCDINDMENLRGAVREAAAEPEGGALCVDYIFHAASNTHPLAYASDPIGTVVTNIIGLNNLLELASELGAERFLFASSNEIYGENRGDIERFDEKYCGYIDCNTMRAGYTESKRAGEALCQAYIRQKGLDVVIPRFTRSFGPTLLKTDTKALSQFIWKGAAGEDIVLKSAGTQYFSYTYVMDAVSGLLTCLTKGVCGEAYNIADESCDIRLKDLARIIADYTGRQVVFEIPDEAETAGYSKATKALLDSSRLKALGWKAQFPIRTALEHTIDILREISSGS